MSEMGPESVGTLLNLPNSYNSSYLESFHRCMFPSVKIKTGCYFTRW